MKPHLLRAFAAVGQAVWMSQIFETALIPIYEIFKIHADSAYVKRTGGFVPPGAYKTPIKNIIKQLTAAGRIDAAIEQKLDAYIESRHILVHRWFVLYGWPDDEDSDEWAKIEAHANSLTSQARDLTQAFTGYLVKYAEPEWAAANPVQYRERMVNIFQSLKTEP